MLWKTAESTPIPKEDDHEKPNKNFKNFDIWDIASPSHLGEVISLKFIVVVVFILQIIDINWQALINSFDALCNPRKIINK